MRANMGKVNWLVVSGNAEIRGNNIKYMPSKRKNQLGNDENVPAFVASNIDFENGEIFFKVSLKDKHALCQIILGTESGTNLNVGINTDDSLFGIIKFDSVKKRWDLLAGNGSSDNLELDKEYEIKINVSGSIISLYVNNILIASAIHEVRQSQLQIAFNSISEIIVKDINVSKINPRAFVVMQFTEEFNELYNEVIKPVCDEFGIECERADDYYTTNMIIQDIISSLTSASVVIAEITPDNPNVFYEVGYAHAINKPTILLCDKKRAKLPFDLSSFRTLFYDNSIAGKTQVESRLRKYLQNIFRNKKQIM